ncbi:MAG: hypothetical protein AB7F91_11085 [Parvularculaceae bacterium]
MGWSSKFENEIERQFNCIHLAVENSASKIGVDLTNDLQKRIKKATDDTKAFARGYLKKLPISLSEFEEKVDWLEFENEILEDELHQETTSLQKQLEGFKSAILNIRAENDILKKQRAELKKLLEKKAIRLPHEYKALDEKLRAIQKGKQFGLDIGQNQ